MRAERFFLGVDLGGTKIRTALVDGTGRIVARDYRETRAEEGPDAGLERILAAADAVLVQAGLSRSHIAAVGIGSPGPLDIERGVIVSPPNLPGWGAFPLRQRVQDALGITTVLENDANAAALGEHRFGAGRGAKHMIYVVAGTGIGGGLILNGELYRGVSGMAGEIGHTTLLPGGPLCGCGNRGCLEALAAGPAIARAARERIAAGMSTTMTELALSDPRRITARLVAEAAAQGDEIARQVLSEAMDYLGLGIANLVNILNPELIVIGGGLANIGEALLGPVRRAIEQHAFFSLAQTVRVVKAELGDDAGALGAAAVAMTLPA